MRSAYYALRTFNHIENIMPKTRRTHFELRAALRETGISQADLSRALHVSPITVYRWVNAKMEIPGYVWAMLSLLDGEKRSIVIRGDTKIWCIEEDDVFPNGESYRDMLKKFHPDITRRDTNAEIAVITEFKNFR